ncbi:MAG: hypothetical protein OYH76_21975 [Defluviicoccus sp.]|nr:hypothetical protein [Defluviicoccus sp.]MDE0278575.1 hypothetical protein [Defluviicoccus sp.]
MKYSARMLPWFMQELAANARLRWGIWLILALLLGHGIVLQSDRLAAVRGDYHAAAEHVRKAASVLHQPDVTALLDSEREINRKIRSTFWQAETEGLAQAKLQAALDGMLGRLGLKDARFRSASVQPVSKLPGVWRTQVRLDATFPPGSELRIVHALATHPEKLVVDRLDLRRHGPDGSYLVLIVSSYFVGLKTELPK